MEKRFYKELWRLRFKKMLRLEKKSVTDYEKLLRECNRRFREHSVVPHLEKLIADEKRHTLLVEQLLQILEQQPD